MAKKSEAKTEIKTETKKVPKKIKNLPAKKVQTEQTENFRGIVRIAGKDIPGEVPIKRALLRVRGISHTLAAAAASAIERNLSIAPNTPTGELNEKQVEDIDKLLFSLHEQKLPSYLMNRCGDFKTGQDKHVIMNDLIFEVSQDIDREMKMVSWRGYRHHYGKKVRGQKTRNTGRKGMAVGVLRKSIIAAQGGAKVPAAGAAAPVKTSVKQPAAAEKASKK
ncbi:MAG: 30S ribosomal protein S13 [Candidatus Micrarchaeota archaeon]